MATQNMRSQDTILNEGSPQSLYELLIYDNHKLAEQSGGPHIIMRRSVKGSEPTFLELSSLEEPSELEQVVQELGMKEEVQLAEEPENQLAEEPADQLAEEPENQLAEESADQLAEEPADQDIEQQEVLQSPKEEGKMVGANEITSYLASLSSHVQSDVLRVVDAIIELEESEPAEMPQSEDQTDQKELDQDNLFEENGGNKGLEIADIFSSLKKARKRAQQKSYSYTKKVEYEDR